MADDAAYKEAKLDFDKEAWLDSQEPCMRKRFEEMFTTQEKVDDHLKDLTRERQELERKYINLCGVSPSRKMSMPSKQCFLNV